MGKERFWRLRRILTGAAVTTLAVVVGAPTASADGFFPTLHLDVIQNGVSVWDTEEVRASTIITDNLDGSFSFEGVSDVGLFTGELVATNGGNPGVAIALQVTNASSSVATFEMSFAITVAALIEPTLMSGWVSGSFHDFSAIADGAVVAAVPGDALYTALIDGRPIWRLMRDPFSATAPAGGATSLAREEFTDQPGPSVVSRIGLRNRFTLTPGDTVRVTSVLMVIPEPASMALMALGSLALVCRRRRRGGERGPLRTTR